MDIKERQRFDDILWYVISTWNPENDSTDDLEYLRKTITIRKGQIYSIGEICKCATTLIMSRSIQQIECSVHKYYEHWKIIELMLKYKADDDMANSYELEESVKPFISILVRCSKELKFNPENIEQNLKPYISTSPNGKPYFEVFCIVADLLGNIQLKITQNEENKRDYTIRHMNDNIKRFISCLDCLEARLLL